MLEQFVFNNTWINKQICFIINISDFEPTLSFSLPGNFYPKEKVVVVYCTILQRNISNYYKNVQIFKNNTIFSGEIGGSNQGMQCLTCAIKYYKCSPKFIIENERCYNSSSYFKIIYKSNKLILKVFEKNNPNHS